MSFYQYILRLASKDDFYPLLNDVFCCISPDAPKVTSYTCSMQADNDVIYEADVHCCERDLQMIISYCEQSNISIINVLDNDLQVNPWVEDNLELMQAHQGGHVSDATLLSQLLSDVQSSIEKENSCKPKPKVKPKPKPKLSDAGRGFDMECDL